MDRHNYMKTLIFSDTHLTHKFNHKLYTFLKKIISTADQVIINGDFWDGQTTTFDKFITSEWKILFPLLKSKKTIYIFGNHDRKKYSDDRVNLFSDLQTENYQLQTKNYKLYIEHGHVIVPFSDKEDDIFTPPVRLNDMYALGEMILCIVTQGHFLQVYRHLFGKKMKAYAKKQLKENEILVTGHIHAPEFDLKSRHINTFLRHDTAYYLVIDDDRLEFIKEKI